MDHSPDEAEEEEEEEDDSLPEAPKEGADISLKKHGGDAPSQPPPDEEDA